MKNLKNAVLSLISLLFFSLPSIAAQSRADEEAAVAAACGAFAIVYVLILLFVLAISIVVIVIIYKYIKKDAIARGDNPSKAWFALLGLLGLLIYILTRPQGNVMPCPGCGQNRMQGLPRCPHCGNA